MMHLDASSPFDHSINCCSIKNQLHLMCIPIVGWRCRGRGCIGRRGPGAAKSPPSTPPIILQPRYLVSIRVILVSIRVMQQRAGYMIVQWVSVWLAVHFLSPLNTEPSSFFLSFLCRLSVLRGSWTVGSECQCRGCMWRRGSRVC